MNSDLSSVALQAGAAYMTGGASLLAGGAVGSKASPSQSSRSDGGRVDVGGLTQGAWNVDVGGGSGILKGSNSVQLAWLAVAAGLVAVLAMRWKRA